MLTRYAAEEPMAEELLIAGIKPLPINRMVRQAGRFKNKSPSGRNTGPMLFSRRDRTRLNLEPNEVETLLRSDPQFKASYERQVIQGKDATMTDKYDVRELYGGDVVGSQFSPYSAGGQIQREHMSRKELNDLTIQRHLKAKETIDNWDPIEASAREDFNRLKGRGDPSAALELIHTIDTPSRPEMSLGEVLFPAP